MHNIQRKLASTKGESLGEVLVASLIAGLALILLATMIMSSKNIITKSEDKIKTIYTGTSMNDKQTATEPSDPVAVTIQDNTSAESATIDVIEYKDEKSAIHSYKRKVNE